MCVLSVGLYGERVAFYLSRWRVSWLHLRYLDDRSIDMASSME